MRKPNRNDGILRDRRLKSLRAPGLVRATSVRNFHNEIRRVVSNNITPSPFASDTRLEHTTHTVRYTGVSWPCVGPHLSLYRAGRAPRETSETRRKAHAYIIITCISLHTIGGGNARNSQTCGDHKNYSRKKSETRRDFRRLTTRAERRACKRSKSRHPVRTDGREHNGRTSGRVGKRVGKMGNDVYSCVVAPSCRRRGL